MAPFAPWRSAPQVHYTYFQLNTKPRLAMNFAPRLPAVFVAGSFRQLVPKGSLREAPG